MQRLCSSSLYLSALFHRFLYSPCNTHKIKDINDAVKSEEIYIKEIHVEEIETIEEIHVEEFEPIEELYVEEYDAKELDINEEYMVVHDGIVVFNIYKTII